MGKEKLQEILIRHEGIRLKSYICPAGKVTIGVGRNIQDVGISRDEAIIMLDNDIKRCYTQLSDRYPWFYPLDSVRQEVLVNMVFNMGIGAFSKFHNLIAFMSSERYMQAAIEMIDSKWAEQVGSRAKELAEMMRTGEYTDGRLRT